LPSNPLIVDLCTGSGALALALAAHRPDARVVAFENSPAALQFARRNAAGTRVEIVDADVTTAGLLPEFDGRVDLLVSNPPYIPEAAVLEPEVAEHDPAAALFGGPDGMAVIRPIVTLAARWLRDGAPCAVEHDDSTSELAVEAFDRDGHFTDVTARRDLAGRPRFVTASRTGRS
ncbi:HemK/PrmC family methyltransferase, partial [Mycolicibacterium fortuitum]